MENLTPALADEDATSAEGVSAPVEEPAPEPVAPETVMVWLAQIKPAAALAVLRDPDFAPASVRAFLGFRINAQGYNSPLVRGRLASEASRDKKLAERLQALAEAEPPAAPILSALPVPLPDAPALQSDKSKEEASRARRNHLRQERDEARFAQKEAEDALARAEDARRRAEDAQADAQRVADIAAARASRLERYVARLKAEADGLRRAVRQQAPPSVGNAPAAPSMPGVEMPAPPDFWADAVRRLLDKGRPEAALALAADVLRADPDNLAALRLSADAYEARADTRAATLFLRRLLSLHIERGRMPDAAEILGKLLPLAPARDAEKDVRVFLSALRPSDMLGTEAARALMSRLAAALPRAHDLFQEGVKAAPPALALALLPPQSGDSPDDPLPLDMQNAPSARQILAAIDADDETLVASVRDALHATLDRAVRAQILNRITEAAGADASYGTLLTARLRGPVIVDGSNVAWYGQELLAAPRARLRSLLEMRRSLREKAYFPILIYADANLPYAIDDTDGLNTLLSRREVRRVDAGTPADIVVLREAKRLNAPLVTNDYMTDWDPNNEVAKIRFDLPPGGGAYLLT